MADLEKTVRYKRGKPFRVRPGESVDLSTWPLGSWSPLHPGRLKIGFCDKCGRKGEVQIVRPRMDRPAFQHTTHVVRYRAPMWLGTDWCSSPGVTDEVAHE